MVSLLGTILIIVGKIKIIALRKLVLLSVSPISFLQTSARVPQNRMFFFITKDLTSPLPLGTDIATIS
jgi:hypothetical protein